MILKAIIISFSLLLSSCYSSQQVIGKGAQGNSYATEWNHNMLYGTVENGACNPEDMAGTAENYTVSTKQSFAHMVLAVITLGVYTPTETTVTR